MRETLSPISLSRHVPLQAIKENCLEQIKDRMKKFNINVRTISHRKPIKYHSSTVIIKLSTTAGRKQTEKEMVTAKEKYNNPNAAVNSHRTNAGAQSKW